MNIEIPLRLLKTEWPPTPQLAPGNPRFDDVYESLLRGERVHEPIIVKQDTWTVIDGHHRLNAAKLAGLETVPVIFWTGTEFVP